MLSVVFLIFGFSCFPIDVLFLHSRDAAHSIYIAYTYVFISYYFFLSLLLSLVAMQHRIRIWIPSGYSLSICSLSDVLRFVFLFSAYLSSVDCLKSYHLSALPSCKLLQSAFSACFLHGLFCSTYRSYQS